MLWPSWAHGNKLVWLVPSLVFRVHLSHCEAAENLLFLSLRIRPLQPLLGYLGILARVGSMMKHGAFHSNPHQMDGTTTARWKNPVEEFMYAEKQHMSEFAHLSSVLPSYFPFTRRHFTRLSSPEGWAWITEHHCRDLCSVMFMAGELKSRKGLWECQQSRKEKTSLVPLASYIFSIRTSCASSQISRLCLFKYEEAPLMQPCSQSPSSLGIAVSGYFQEVLRSIKCEQIWQSCRGRGLICSKHAAVNNLNI